MSKSNYPNKLDTSVEIPVVRDNITEIGSDVLNGLRAAIFNIERTLGLNPHGSSGGTVSSRLSNVLDENGNILPEALDKAGLLSGPVTNSDVSKSAAISENKLRLDFPTSLLQNEISTIDNRISLIIESLEELNRLLSSHIHPEATNRHKAKAVTVEAATPPGSSSASTSVQSGTVQDALEDIYSSHVNYSGESIGQSNRSHTGLQIFYDNQYNSDLIPSSSVQGAIDDLANIEGVGLRSSVLNLNSNGIIRTGDVYSAADGTQDSKALIDPSDISYSKSNGSSTMVVALSSEPESEFEIKPFDTLEIINSPFEEDNKDFIISSVVFSGPNKVQSVTIFGGPKNEYTPGTSGIIKRSPYSIYNENSLNCAIRPRTGFSNTPIVQVANPNSSTVISSGIRASNIQAGLSDTLAIDIDESGAIEIPVHNAVYPVQTIDTIISTINQYCVDNNLNIFAYKLRSLKCYEIAISHNMPNDAADITARTLRVVDASSNDAAEALGFEYLKDRLVEGQAGNSFHINGRILESIGSLKKYGSEIATIRSGTNEIAFSPPSIITDGVRVGDICVIEGSSVSQDNGSYAVRSVEDDKVTLYSSGSVLSGSLEDASAVFFIGSAAPISELEFITPLGPSTDATMMIDIFLDENSNIFYHKRMDILGHLTSGNFYASVTDVTNNFITNDSEFTLTITPSGAASIREEPGFPSGPDTFVGSTGTYKIYSSNKMSYITLDVYIPNSAISPFGAADITATLFGYSEVPDSNLHLSRAMYSPKFGSVLEDFSLGLSGEGVFRITDKRVSGTIDDTIIAPTLLERYIQGPRNELRGSGVIRDTRVDSVSDNGDGATCSITIDPGVLVVNGVRFEYLGVENLSYNYTNGATNNFYIAVDGNGCLLVANEVDPASGTNYISPFSERNVAHIGFVDMGGPEIIDLRLFVDHIDYKALSEVSVSNDQRFGHFTDIKSAVDYCRESSKLFPDSGTPGILIHQGVHEISERLEIDFDIKIRGSGPGSIIKRSASFNLTESSIILQDKAGVMILVGKDAETNIDRGVTIEDITFEGTEGQGVVGGSFITVRHNINTTGNSNSSSFVFNRLKFIAASDYLIDVDPTVGLPNQMPFHIGYGAGGLYQNIIISNCYFYKVGYKKGVVYLNTHNEYRNISVINNISVKSLDTTTYSMIREDGTSALTNVQEVNNMIEDA